MQLAGDVLGAQKRLIEVAGKAGEAGQTEAVLRRQVGAIANGGSLRRRKTAAVTTWPCPDHLTSKKSDCA